MQNIFDNQIDCINFELQTTKKQTEQAEAT